MGSSINPFTKYKPGSPIIKVNAVDDEVLGAFEFMINYFIFC